MSLTIATKLSILDICEEHGKAFELFCWALVNLWFWTK